MPCFGTSTSAMLGFGIRPLRTRYARTRGEGARIVAESGGEADFEVEE